jgi:hypothetical protein
MLERRAITKYIKKTQMATKIEANAYGVYGLTMPTSISNPFNLSIFISARRRKQQSTSNKKFLDKNPKNTLEPKQIRELIKRIINI